MRVLAIVVAFSVMLVSGVAQAQVPAPATQKPAAPAPATQKPAAPAPAAAAALPPLPKFQDGFKYAYVRVDRIAAESAEGRVAADRIKSLQEQKQRELQEKNKNLLAAQQKLDSGGSVLSDAARTQLQTEIERQQRDLQRFTEDAQQDVQSLAATVEEDFNRKLTPIIDKVAKDKQVHFVFNATQSGLVWADPGMDLTGDVIAAMNAPGAAARPPAAAPSAPAAPATVTPKP
ncbi:MAG TPA: OmpH family outer membrane protein [Vicinamibacterales bacterium]|nr:OmpH family outer membrane protein [Vicinamibacterales bacterium]